MAICERFLFSVLVVYKIFPHSDISFFVFAPLLLKQWRKPFSHFGHRRRHRHHQHQKIMEAGLSACKEWRLSDSKVVKMFCLRRPRFTFQCSRQKPIKRGISISEEAFRQLFNISNTPIDGCDYDSTFESYKLDDNVTLCCYGKLAKLTRYCTTKDRKQVDGSFIFLNADEWSQLMGVLPEIKRDQEKTRQVSTFHLSDIARMTLLYAYCNDEFQPDRAATSLC
jgi:hypothetical protein